MTSQPTWAAIDDETADLLHLVADEGHPSADFEWDAYCIALTQVVDAETMRVDPNCLRELIRGIIAPKRIGAFTSRAKAQGLLVDTGEWVTSTDREGRNAGRPVRVYRLGGAR